MQAFAFKGKSANGEIISGTIDGPDASSVARVLIDRQIVPIEINQSHGVAITKAKAKKSEINFLTPQVSLEDLIIFCRQMYSLTKAGIPIIRSISGLSETKNLRMRAALSEVIDQLEKGRNLSSALSQHPKIFNQLFVSIIHVGENTGQLEAAFKQLASYCEREQETRKQIKAATRYPMFVVIALAAAMVILNIFVIPVFAGMFAKFDTELPLMTRILLASSDFFVNQWYILIAMIMMSILAIRYYLSTEKGRIGWDRTKLKIPVIGAILERSLLARFSRSFSLMLSSGVPLTSALSLVSDAVANAFMQKAIIDMRRRIEKGEDLTRVSRASGLFTPLVMQMISVGEETGKIDDMLEEVADFYALWLGIGATLPIDKSLTLGLF